ncbi:MAG: hypothetical protein GY778_06310 [bacterium]|nr:hypothetical protein [bacterium]
MDVYLDDKPTTLHVGDAGTLGELVENAGRQVGANDRVIVGIVCDGIDVDSGDFEAALAEPADRYGRIDLQSGSVEALVRDALAQAQQVLADTESLREQVVDDLTRGQTEQARTGLGECLKNWSQVHQAVTQSIAFLKLDPGTLMVGDRSLDAAINAVGEQLTLVKDALLAGDDVMLADVLQYEFDEVCTVWNAAIEAILGRIAPPADG